MTKKEPHKNFYWTDCSLKFSTLLLSYWCNAQINKYHVNSPYHILYSIQLNKINLTDT